MKRKTKPSKAEMKSMKEFLESRGYEVSIRGNSIFYRMKNGVTYCWDKELIDKIGDYAQKYAKLKVDEVFEEIERYIIRCRNRNHPALVWCDGCYKLRFVFKELKNKFGVGK